MLEYPKKIAWWQGTDSLKLIMFPPGAFIWKIRIVLHRIFWKLFYRLFEHWVVHPTLREELVRFGIPREKIKIKVNIPKYYKISKREHTGFYVLYYRPLSKRNQKYKDWVYGYDIYKEVANLYMPDVYFIEVNGGIDMRLIYPWIDLYIRPNRHDGMPLMILECIQYKIPYYWSKDFKPSVGEIINAIEKMREDNEG